MTLLKTMVRGRLMGALLLLLLCMTTVGCSRGEVELKNTVTAYNRMLIESLAKPDANIMEYFTTPIERQRIEAYITYLLKDGKIAICTLKKIDFSKVSRDKKAKSATVTTSEEWSYHHVDVRSRQPVSGEEKMNYHNVYHLIEEEGHWVVEKVSMNETR